MQTPLLALALLTHIVFIGDSHSAGEFGKVIDDWFRVQPQTSFEFVASGGSAPLQWTNNAFVTSCAYTDQSSLPMAPKRQCVENFRTPTLKSLLAKDQTTPERIAIVALGTNYGIKPQDQAGQLQATIRLIKEIPAAGYRCIWIGPPDMKRFDEARVEKDYETIRTAIAQAAAETKSAPCTLIDSRLYSKYPTPVNAHENPDGIHYDYPAAWYRFPEGKLAADDWARGVIGELNEAIYLNSTHP